MIDQSFQSVIQHFQEKKYFPLYFIQGEENFFIDSISQYLENEIIPQEEKSFNQIILYGKDVKTVSIIEQAVQYPVMSERRLVLVKEAQDVADLTKEDGLQLMKKYYERPVPTTVLIFCYKNKTLDKRTGMGKMVKDWQGFIHFTKLHERDTGKFIQQYAKQKNYSLTAEAQALLADQIGPNPQKISNELDKLFLGTTPDKPVSYDDVLKKVGIHREYNNFELQKALFLRNTEKVAKISRYLQENLARGEAIPLIAYLYSVFSKVLVLYSLGNQSNAAIAKALKIMEFAVPEYQTAKRNYTVPQLIQILTLLHDTDLKLKGVDSGNTNELERLKELLTRIML